MRLKKDNKFKHKIFIESYLTKNKFIGNNLKKVYFLDIKNLIKSIWKIIFKLTNDNEEFYQDK